MGLGRMGWLGVKCAEVWQLEAQSCYLVVSHYISVNKRQSNVCSSLEYYYKSSARIYAGGYVYIV